MASGSLFFFTFKKAEKAGRTDVKTFSYPLSFFESLGSKYGFRTKDRSLECNHTRGQQTVQMTKDRMHVPKTGTVRAVYVHLLTIDRVSRSGRAAHKPVRGGMQ